MEAQQLALCSEGYRGFEAVYNTHTRDVDFFQRSQKIISALQVELKSEVARSNGQSEALHVTLSSAKDALAAPSTEILQAFVDCTNKAIAERAAYLGMTKASHARPNPPIKTHCNAKLDPDSPDRKAAPRSRPRTGQRSQSVNHIVPK